MEEDHQHIFHSSNSHELDQVHLAFNSEDMKQNGPMCGGEQTIMEAKDGGLVGKGQTLLENSRTASFDTSQRDYKLVTWDGPNDPENPRNWPRKKKQITLIIVLLFTVISPISSTIVAPALKSIAASFDIKEEFLSQLTLTSFILAYVVGPLFLGPFSETYGRVIVLQLATLFYLVFNTACGISQSKGQMITFRFLAGLGGPLAVGGGVIGDTFHTEERGIAMAIYSLAPFLGPVIGPIIGGFISENTTWRWIFYSTSIATGIIQITGILFLRETYGPRILQIRAKKIRKETGNLLYQTKEEQQNKTLFESLKISLIRPIRLLTTQPIIQVLALYMAYIFGLQYLMMSTFPALWTDLQYYGESTGIGGLNYISLGLGALLGSYICAYLNDQSYRRLKARNHGIGKPEFRLPLLAITTICIPAGLFIYGWTAQTHQHWIAPNIGACLFSLGNMMTFQCMQTYTVDTYTQFSASAMAAISVLRNLAAFGFPLFAPYMYHALHYGWGNSLLAFIAIGLGIPASIFLWRYGEKLRKVSPYAAG